MLVSVIIPTYNSEKLLLLAVQSVLNQTYGDFEIIIIDDGSTDNTKQALGQFKDERIKYIYQENAGPAVARNKGINLAKGEYVAFLDADDKWVPEKLEIQINVFKENKDIGLVYSAIDMEVESFQEREIERHKNCKTKEDLVKHLLFNAIGIVPSIIVKKDILNQAGLFDANLRLGEDWDLWIRIACLTNFYYVDKVLVIAFRPTSSLTSSYNMVAFEKYYLEVLNKFFANPDNLKKFGNLKSSAYSQRHYLFALATYYRNRENPPLRNVFGFFFKSFYLDPLSYITKYERFRFSARIFFRLLTGK